MLAEGSGYVWLLLLLYVIPVVIFYKSVMRFYKKREGTASEVSEVPPAARPEVKRFYKITLLVPGKPGPWPILCLFGSFAALFVISIFSVLLLIG